MTTTYTHDAWNRLVKIVVGSSTQLEQEYNGLNWRTAKRADTDATGGLDEKRTFAYSANWQLLDERVDSDYVAHAGLNKRVQHVWGKRYIDDAVLLRADINNDGDYTDTNEGTWYHLTDAMYSSVALITAAGTVAERVTYDAYGNARHHWRADVNGDGAVTATGTGNDSSIVSGIAGGSNHAIGQANYRAECDINRDGDVTATDTGLVTAKAAKAAKAGGLIRITNSRSAQGTSTSRQFSAVPA